MLALVVIYLACELLIWGLSCILVHADITFFAPVLAMAIVFLAKMAICSVFPSCEVFYTEWIRSKVNFINVHMSIGFPIPIVMLGATTMIQSRQIAYVVGAFVITSVLSWTVVFIVSLMAMRLISALGQTLRQPSESPSISAVVCKLIGSYRSTVVSNSDSIDQAEGTTPTTSPRSSIDSPNSSSSGKIVPSYDRPAKVCIFYPMVVSMACALIIGAPITAATGDSRILDGCVLWFVWITAHRTQHLFKTSNALPDHETLKNTFTTLMNPVLLATLTLMAYVRARAAATPGLSLDTVLDNFSGGQPLYALWTASVTGTALPDNPTLYFGAGDAALSLLECGIVVWGFKLSECQEKMFTTAGLLTVTVSMAAAAANVFLSVGCARILGVNAPEALSFAARSTTLALAKPAIEAVGGNLGVNATLVVINGILGQLIYPFVLGAMGIAREVTRVSTNHGRKQERGDGPGLLKGRYDEEGPDREMDEHDTEQDDAMTIATGTSIGINGAAMGVAYLYETRSRAAAYAALSMTVFGAMTVVFTTSEPFKGLVLDLAGA
ncbi:LrgB-like family [Geosmithia morbida]|uniref:LrgB-like family n=1 Tax=Geosmithia morbida TaxID=1094350 RepID=A0A9P4YMU8_9HYPO|nr:LrgB-like family [Geosmithia morbida]KAF4119367.1 LrgB-like family [Geosmithia morbida]